MKKDDHEYGIFALRLYKDGQPVVVIIDDFVITEDEIAVTMESKAWANLVEKARAKLYGTYLDSFK